MNFNFQTHRDRVTEPLETQRKHGVRYFAWPTICVSVLSFHPRGCKRKARRDYTCVTQLHLVQPTEPVLDINEPPPASPARTDVRVSSLRPPPYNPPALRSHLALDHHPPGRVGFVEMTLASLDIRVKTFCDLTALTLPPSPWFCIYPRGCWQVEVAVTKAVHGETVNNLSALANPDSLQQFHEAGRALRGLAPFPSPPPPVS